MPILGIVGIIQLETGKYLMVIKDRSLAGYYGGQPVYRIEDVSIVPLHELEILIPAVVSIFYSKTLILPES